MVIADRHGLPVAAHVDSASPHEVTLIEATLDKMALPYDPGVLIGDKAYDSDKHDAMLYETRGIILVAPNREKRSKTQDGRALRRYKRRWQVERVNAWLQNFRRVVVRYEFHAANFLAFVQLACIMILLRQS